MEHPRIGLNTNLSGKIWTSPPEELLRTLIDRHWKSILGQREKHLEEMLLMKAMDLEFRLIETRSDDGLTTSWHFESRTR